MEKKELNIKFERAVRLLGESLPVSDENTRKPILAHDIRVGVYLYENGYSDDVVLAGLLHDAVEFAGLGEQELNREFGERVAKIVAANSKNDSIDDKIEKTEDVIKRCVAVGEDALVVKAVDVMDSFKYYSAEKNYEQLKYCKRYFDAILKFKPNNFTDKIFDELKDLIP
jgi:(p)ppGpp synthase/HD superfamily hydrolase